MQSETQPEAPALIVRPRRPEDDEAVIELWQHVHPEFPRESVAEYRFWLEHSPSTGRWEAWSAELDGEIVGHGELHEEIDLHDPDIFFFSLVVDRERWGQGIGRALYNQLEDRARVLGAHRLRSEFRADCDHSAGFLERRGFAPTGQIERMSRLNVRRAWIERYEGVEDRLRAEGIRIATFAELDADDEALLRAIYELDEEAMRDMPSSEEFGGRPFEDWRRAIFAAPGASPERIWIAMHGDRPVGVAFLPRWGDESLENGGTAVTREYRGRGIAQALKVRTVRWAREHGFEWIYTGNNASNAPMLAINTELGYEPLPRFVEVAKELYEQNRRTIS